MLLTLLLLLGVIGASIMPYCVSRTSDLLCEVEEDALEELLEEQFETCEDLLCFEWLLVEAECRMAVSQPSSVINRLSPAQRSFGWILPLRI